MSLNKNEALRQAEQYVQQGNMSSAIAVYRKIVEADPFDLSVISALGDLYVKANRTPDAINYLASTADNYLRKGSTNSAIYLLNKVLKLDSLNAQVYMKIGEIYLRDGSHDKAHDCFIEAGAAFWQKNNPSAAREANKRALQVKPESRQARAALAALHDESFQSQPEPVQAVITGDLQPIMISITDDSATSSATVETSNFSQALPESQADLEYLASQQSPLSRLTDDTIIQHISAAEMLVAYGKIDEAIAKLRQLLKRKPDDIEIRVKLKDVYLRGERIERASEECLNIAAIYAARGDSVRAKDFMIRAELLERTFEQLLFEDEQDQGGEADDSPFAKEPENP
jgi:Flp pilus assembly protein TadD